MQPTISIIVPVYKAEKYLHRCIDSILSQTFTNFELILVNDGSPDNCGTICDEYAARDGRIKVVHKKNCGVTAARRDGVNQATGEWVMFVDADDTIPYDSIEKLYNNVTSSMIDIVMGSWRKCAHNGSRIIPLPIIGELGSKEYTIALLEEKAFLGPVGKIYRKTLFCDSIFDINKEIKTNEDLIMNLKLAKNINRIKACPQLIVYNYFQNPGSASRLVYPITTYDLIFETLINLMGEKYKKYVWKYISETFLRYEKDDRFLSSTYYSSLILSQKEFSCFSVIWHNINIIKSNDLYSRLFVYFVRIYLKIRKITLFLIASLKEKFLVV